MRAPPADSSAAMQACLYEFNLLPSRSLHPDRARQLLAHADPLPSAIDQAPVVRLLHQRWSQQLLLQLGENASPVLDTALAALPLALLAPAALMRLAREAGITLLGGHLRRTISQQQVVHARETLGESALDWVRNGAAALHPGIDDAAPWLEAGLQQGADQLGTGLLAQSWQDAPASLRLRADWKLSPAVDAPAVRRASALDPQGARHLCLQLLARMDPTWLSNFPVSR